MAMKIIAGLGNPGPEYERTPHNVGFRVVNGIAERFSASWRDEPKFKGSVARIKVQGVDVLLLKPSTYMNLSGEAVEKLMHYYGVEASGLAVVSDDADLPVGRLRIRPGGGAGGHRGLLSIIGSCGSNSFARVRVGIGRSVHGGNLAEHVLGRLPEEEEAILQRTISTAAEAAVCVVTQGVDKAMNGFNGGDANDAAPQVKKERD